MSFRDIQAPPVALEHRLRSIQLRVEEADRRSMWFGSTNSAFTGPIIPTPTMAETTTPGYPGVATTTLLTLNLNPGRWVVMFRATGSIAASSGGEVVIVSKATFNGSTKTNTTRGSGSTGPFPIAYGNTYTLSNALEILATTEVELELQIYYGYYPTTDPVPYSLNEFFNAAIIAFPG